MKVATVTTTPSQIIEPYEGQRFLAIQPRGGDVYIKLDGSGTTLTTTNGLLVTDGQLLILANDAGGQRAFTNGIEAVSAGSVDVICQGQGTS